MRHHATASPSACDELVKRDFSEREQGLPKEAVLLGNMISVAHAGGQGKTTLAQLLYIWGSQAGGQFKLAAADFLDESGRSKIGKLYPGKVLEFGTGANLTAVRSENNMNASVRYWDELGNLFLTGGYILDVGANIVKSVFEWAEDRRLSTVLARKGAPKFDIFCICKAEKHATDDIQRLVRLIGQGHALRPRNIFIVLNEAAGNFGAMKLQEKLTSDNKDLESDFRASAALPVGNLGADGALRRLGRARARHERGRNQPGARRRYMDGERWVGGTEELVRRLARRVQIGRRFRQGSALTLRAFV